MKKLISITLIFFLSYYAIAQPAVKWTVNGTFAKMQLTNDGGCIGFSATENLSPSDTTMKISAVGVVQWTQNFISTAIIQTTDGGYIASVNAPNALSSLTGYQGGNDAWIVKINAAGSIVWQFNTGGNGDDQMVDLKLN